jgi:hypothetical protein
VDDLSEAKLQVDTSQSGSACLVYFQPHGDHIYLANDSGSWMSAMTPGAAGTESNSQCTLNAGSSWVSAHGNDLTLAIALTFSTSFKGPKNVYLYGVGASGQNRGWVQKGTWTP